MKRANFKNQDGLTLRAEGGFRLVFQDNFNTSTEINYRRYKILATGMEER